MDSRLRGNDPHSEIFKRVAAGASDLPAYTAELESWREAAAHLRAHPEEAAALRQRLPGSWSVTVEGQRFVVSTRSLADVLDQLIRDPRAAARAAPEACAQLEAMLEDARALSSAAVRDYKGAHAKLDNILRRREFRFRGGPREFETWWNRLMHRLWQWAVSLLERAGSHPGVAGFLLWGTVVALGLVFLGWLIYALSRVSYRRLPLPGAAPPAPPRRDWLEKAGLAAARGEFRDAIRMLYAAAVVRLGEAGVWQVDPSRTHREYVRLLPADSLLRPHLMTLTASFERVWYGHAPASAGDYEAALAELESLA